MSPDDLETYGDILTQGLVATLASIAKIDFESYGDAEHMLDGFQKIAWVADSLNRDRRAGLRSA